MVVVVVAAAAAAAAGHGATAGWCRGDDGG